MATETISVWRPLSFPTYRYLWASIMLSNLGTMVQIIGAGWLMATISESDAMVALTQASITMPAMFLSVLAGALADSFDRRRLMIFAQCFMLVSSTILAILTFLDFITPWLLLILVFLVGCGASLHIPAWQASIGDIIPRTYISGAVTLNIMTFNIMRALGPAFGGLVVAAAGAAAAFMINALSYLPVIATLSLWKRHKAATKPLPREPLGSAVWAGLRYISMSPNIAVTILRGFTFSFCAVSVLALLPLIARDVLNGTPITFGALLASFGTGAIISALASARIRDRFDNETVARIATIGFALSAAILANSAALWQSCLALLPAGASWLLILSLLNMMVQLSTPRWVVARALSIYQTANFGGMALGSWVWGMISGSFSPMIALLSAATLLASTLAIGFRFSLPSLLPVDLNPANKFRQPSLAVELDARSGPVAIFVEYEIDPDDVPAFQAAMADRRRIRIRDGAHNWSLLCDLQNPRLWVESFHAPTWTEYVRHHERRTLADVDSTDRLIALHRGQQRPAVRFMIQRQTTPSADEAFKPMISP